MLEDDLCGHLRPSLAVITLVAALAAGVAAQDLTLPNKPTGTLKFAVIGDSGTGDSNQYKLAKVFTDIHQRFPYAVRADDGRQHVRR